MLKIIVLIFTVTVHHGNHDMITKASKIGYSTMKACRDDGAELMKLRKEVTSFDCIRMKQDVN